MIISNSYLVICYFISVLLFFNYNSPFIFWMITEINLILFICMIMSFKELVFKQEVFDLVLFYFLIQSAASILILSDFFFSSDFYIFNSSAMFVCSMLIKLGIFPFFFWVFMICDYLSWISFWLLMTIQKVPFFLFLFYFFDVNLVFLTFLSFIVGTVLILNSLTFARVLVSSSIASSFLLFYLFTISLNYFLLFFLFYSCFLLGISKFYSKLYSMDSSDFSYGIMFFMFLLGLSPMGLFFFKLDFINFLFFNMGILELIFFWILTFISLLGYMKFCFKMFFTSFSLYGSKFMNYLFSSFFFINLMFFFFFFVY